MVTATIFSNAFDLPVDTFLFIPPYLLSQVLCFLLERLVYYSVSHLASLHIIIAKFVAEDFIIVYCYYELNQFIVAEDLILVISLLISGKYSRVATLLSS